jgi:hypothetical protein
MIAVAANAHVLECTAAGDVALCRVSISAGVDHSGLIEHLSRNQRAGRAFCRGEDRGGEHRCPLTAAFRHDKAAVQSGRQNAVVSQTKGGRGER